MPEGILLKCLSEREAYLGVLNVHSGACASHQDGHKMKLVGNSDKLIFHFDGSRAENTSRRP